MFHERRDDRAAELQDTPAKQNGVHGLEFSNRRIFVTVHTSGKDKPTLLVGAVLQVQCVEKRELSKSLEDEGERPCTERLVSVMISD